MSDSVKIVKVGAGPTPSKPVKNGGVTRKRHEPQHKYRQPKHGVLKGGKTARAKIHPVRDPARAPPTRKGVLKILTERGAEKRRAQIRKTVRSMPDSKVRHVLKASGLPVSEKAPPHIVRDILEGGIESGMIVSG
jgi:hypothetical protein